VLELGLDRSIHPLVVEVALEQVAFHIGLRPDATRGIEIAPSRLLRGCPGALGALTGGTVLGGELRQVALRERKLLPLQAQLFFEHRHPLPVPGRELFRDLNRLGVGHLRRQPATTLGIDELLSLLRQLALGGGKRIAHRTDGDLRLKQRGVQLTGASPGIARWSVVGEELLEPGHEPFEHGGIVRITDWRNGRDRPGGRQGTGRVTLLDMPRRLFLLPMLGLMACSTGQGGGACGLTAIAGATMLLQEFAIPGQTLGAPPASLPPRLVARVAAGPAFEAEVGRTPDSAWVIGVQGSVPATIKPGFGVLVLDRQGKARGVLIYESDPIRGAPPIGKLNVDTLMLPLLGIQLDPTRFEDARCPVFPDSLLR
jgi:hypothetical protein